MIEASVVVRMGHHTGRFCPQRAGSAAVQIQGILEPEHLGDHSSLVDGRAYALTGETAVDHNQIDPSVGGGAYQSAGMALGIEARTGPFIAGFPPVQQKHGTCRHRFLVPAGDSRILGGVATDNLHLMAAHRHHSIHPEDLGAARLAATYTVILHQSGGIERFHIEIAPVYGAYRIMPERQGFGAVCVLRRSIHYIGLITTGLIADDGYELGGFE